MHIRNYYRKRLLVSVLSIAALLVVVSASAYAIFVTRISNTEDQVINVGNLQITYQEGSQIIDIQNVRPMIDSVGREQTNNIYNFSIENTGNLAYHYHINLIDNPNFATNILPHQFIRFSLNGGETRVLSDYNNANIFEGVLNPGATQEFTLQIWVGSGNQTDATLGLPNEILGSEIHLKIDIYGRAGFEEEPVPEPDFGLTNSNNGAQELEFTFTGEIESVTLPACTFQFEVWGAQGGGFDGFNDGRGGYSTGTKAFNESTEVFIVIGERPNTTVAGTIAPGGFGGGGQGGRGPTTGGGGGATHIALASGHLTDTNVRTNILLVAGGGGGNGGQATTATLPSAGGSGGHGGGLTGLQGNFENTARTGGQGGTQTMGGPGGSANNAAGTAGVAGQGGNGGLRATNTLTGPGGGGGGWFGGGGGGNNNGDQSNQGAGGGGSGHLSSLLTNAQMIAGNQEMPNPSGGTMTGNTGNGFARITLIQC